MLTPLGYSISHLSYSKETSDGDVRTTNKKWRYQNIPYRRYNYMHKELSKVLKLNIFREVSLSKLIQKNQYSSYIKMTNGSRKKSGKQYTHNNLKIPLSTPNQWNERIEWKTNQDKENNDWLWQQKT